MDVFNQYTPLERAYLNAVFHYHRDNSSSAQDAAVSKEVFKLIKAGQLELAAIKAGENETVLQLWELALDAADLQNRQT